MLSAPAARDSRGASTLTEVYVAPRACEQEIERIAMELSLVEKGKVYVKGIFDQKEALEKQKAA